MAREEPVIPEDTVKPGRQVRLQLPIGSYCEIYYSDKKNKEKETFHRSHFNGAFLKYYFHFIILSTELQLRYFFVFCAV